MSVRTPILTMSSETCARDADDASIAAASAPSMDRLLANIPSSPCGLAHWPLCLQAVVAANWSHLQLIWAGVNLVGRRGRPPAVSGSVYFRSDSGHTRPMTSNQRLPASLTPLDVALAALLNGVEPVIPAELPLVEALR